MGEKRTPRVYEWQRSSQRGCRPMKAFGAANMTRFTRFAPFAFSLALRAAGGTVRPMKQGGRKWLVIGLVVLGLVFLAIGIMYLTIPAKDLPSFLPGKPSYCTGKVLTGRCKILVKQGFNDKKLTKRGVAVEILAVLAFVGAWYASRSGSSTPSEPNASTSA